MQQPAAPPAGRYGPSGRPRGKGAVAAVVVLATAFLGWVVWAALGAAEPAVGGQVTAFRILSDEVTEVRVAAVAGSPGPLACSVRALDRTRDVVGVATVALDPDDPAERERWVTVRTRGRAVTATVGECAATR